jgi:hypothetical protein
MTLRWGEVASGTRGVAREILDHVADSLANSPAATYPAAAERHIAGPLFFLI